MPYPCADMFTRNNTHQGVSVPLRQSLEMSVSFGESYQLPASLFGPDLVSRVVVEVTDEFPQKILYSSTIDILLSYGPGVDINRVECQASWIDKPVHLQFVKPSGVELKKFGVMGSIRNSSPTSWKPQV